MLKIQSNIKLYFFSLLLGSLFIPSLSVAHRVTIFAWVEGSTVHTQSRFAGGRAVKNGNITVYNAQDNAILTGKTDTKGEFRFELADSAGARIVLDAGMGHGNEWMITAPDVTTSETADRSSTTNLDEHSHGMDGMHRDQLNAIIEKTIDNKLKPIMNSIEKLYNRQPSVTDILGVLGYIFGLVGVAAYVHSRKPR